MAKIISFARMNRDSENANGAKCSLENRLEDLPCKSPIIITRRSRNAISLAFHLGFFDAFMLEITMKIQAYGANWALSELNKRSSPQYKIFSVELKEDFGEDNGNVLATIAGKITKAVYLNELREWTNDVKISDLTTPRHYTLWSGANINKRTQELLTGHGISTIRELLTLTREDICQIPGMTTSEVVKLEKSLASRGLSLDTKVDAFCLEKNQAAL